jgi:formate dehydrogenase subunit gamma
MRFSQWVTGFVLAVIALLYLIVGGDKLEKPRSGVKIERWTFGERFLHWYTALMFIIMAITGLSLLLGRIALIPIFGHALMAGWLGASKVLHNYCGPLLLVGIFLEFVIWIRHNIPKKFDLEWLKRLGGQIGVGPRPHAEKINAGEAWFWLMFLFGVPWNSASARLTIVAVLFVTSFGHIYMGT